MRNKVLALIFGICIIFCFCILIYVSMIEKKGGDFSPQDIYRGLKARLFYVYENVAIQGKDIQTKHLQRAIDGNPLTSMGLNVPGEIVYNFNTPTDIGKIEIFFAGNLHHATSYHAVQYKIEGFDGNRWINLVSKDNNRIPKIVHYLTPHITVSSLKFTFSKAFFPPGIEIGEINIYRPKGIYGFLGIFQYLNGWNKSIIASFLYALLFLSFLFVPGYCIAHYFPGSILDREDKFIFGFFFSIVLITFISLLGLVTGIMFIFYLLLPILIVSITFIIRKGWWKEYRKLDPLLIIVMPLFLLLSLLYQYHRDAAFALPYIEDYIDTLKIPPMPYFGYHADNLFSWRIAKVFLHQMNLVSPETTEFIGISIFTRTPLLALLNVPFLYLFGESHFIYQKVLTVLAGLFLLPLYLVMRNIFGTLTARVAILAVMVNSLLFFFSLQVECYLKYFAFFPICLMLLLLKKREIIRWHINLLAGFTGGIAYFIHPAVSILYIVAIFSYVIIERRSRINVLKSIFIIGVMVLVAVFLWKGFSDYHISKSSQNKNIYLETILYNNEHPMKTRLINLTRILIPDDNRAIFGEGISLISAVSPFVFILFIIAMIASYKKYKYLLILVFLPSVSIALLRGKPDIGEIIFGFYFAIPLIIAIVVHYTLHRFEGAKGGSIILSLYTLYLGYNVFRGTKIGHFFMPQILQNINSTYITTYIGMLLYLVIVSILLCQAIISDMLNIKGREDSGQLKLEFED